MDVPDQAPGGCGARRTKLCVDSNQAPQAGSCAACTEKGPARPCNWMAGTSPADFSLHPISQLNVTVPLDLGTVIFELC